ncbi:ABC transporter substrate-binding protein [Halobacteriales archaeon QS_1_69_70]|nr:MAG: ABC transporter substrate-binding protein [Halobacteriales archaeon QS_1_69_70]
MVGHERSSIDGGVSRRRFVAAAGATGAVAGVAGCLGGSDALQITMDQEWAGAEETVIEALYDAGLDTGVDVEILPGDFDSGQRRASFTSALDAGRSSPDVFMMDTGWTIPFIVRDQLVNLKEVLSGETLSFVESDYLQAAVDAASHPESGDLYGLPLFQGYPVMHYRKDLVEAAGYDTEGWATEPLSWSRFAEVAADVLEANPELDYGFTTQAANYIGTACCTFNEMMTSWGGAYFGGHENLFGPIGERPVTVDEEPVYETIRMMRSFMYGPDAEHANPDLPQITTSDLIEFKEEPSRQPFTEGRAAFMRNWPYAIPINLNSGGFTAGEDYDVMPLPYGVEEGEGAHDGTGGSSHALGGWNLTINENTARLEDCVAVLEAFANQDVMVTILGELGLLPPDPSVLKGADRDAVGGLSAFVDTLEVSGQNTVPRPVTAAWPDESPLISDEVTTAYLGQKSPQEAMGDLAERLDRVETEVQ